MSSIDIFKLRDILLQDIDYNYTLDELLKLNSHTIRTDDHACRVIYEKDLSKATESLIDVVYRTNPLVADNTIIDNTKKLVILYYIFVMLLYSMHHKKNFFMPSGLELVVRDTNWGKTYSGDTYKVILESGSNPSIAIYFIVGIRGKGDKKIYLKAYVNNYNMKDNELILACGDEKREYIRQYKTKLEHIDLNLIFDLLQSIYDKMK